MTALQSWLLAAAVVTWLLCLQGCAVAVGAAGGALVTSQICRHPATAHSNAWLCGQR